MPYWVRDQAAHFKNQVLETLGKEYKIHHKFAVAYSPWVYGTVESFMRHILAACRALLSEWNFGPQDWSVAIGCIITALNEAPRKWVGGDHHGVYRCPAQVMTGLKPTRSLLKLKLEGKANWKAPGAN